VTTISRSAIVPYSAPAMFDLVADVESYPQFLPWCSDARSQSLTEDEDHATVEISKGKLRTSFTTRNLLDRGRSIKMHLVDGPFRSLEGRWKFEPLGDAGCKVSLDMEFEFSNRLMAATAGRAFGEIASTLVDAFSKRAMEVYGRR
jgi:ribosome-associated toxin RatA of RatAB toxin-antitoxin module